MSGHAPDDQVCIGVGVKPHGVRGAVQLISLTEVPGRYRKGLKVEWRHPDQAPRPLTISSAQPAGARLVVKFKEIADRTQADSFKGGSIWAPPEAAPPAEEGAYYHYQLLGMNVTDEAGEPLGELVTVLSPGAHDVYEVRMADGTLFMVPAVSEFVREVDVEAGRMVIRPLPGLIPDPNEKKNPR